MLTLYTSLFILYTKWKDKVSTYNVFLLLNMNERRVFNILQLQADF